MTGSEEKTAGYALLSEVELALWGPSLKRVFVLPRDFDFDDLLAKLDRSIAEERNDKEL